MVLLCTYICVYCCFVAGESVGGAFFGQGTGPQLAACPDDFIPVANFVPVIGGNCSTLSLDPTCTHDRDVGLRCSPGQRKPLSYYFTHLYSSC